VVSRCKHGEESFDALLAWLDSNPESAAAKYEVIRSRLIKVFVCRGCQQAEDLADETIDRVARKLDEIRTTFTGEPLRYFYGVANKVHLEYLRRKPAPAPPAPVDDQDEIEREYDCLERCIQKLSADNRELVLQYYQEDKQAKIDNRKSAPVAEYEVDLPDMGRDIEITVEAHVGCSSA